MAIAQKYMFKPRTATGGTILGVEAGSEGHKLVNQLDDWENPFGLVCVNNTHARIPRLVWIS